MTTTNKTAVLRPGWIPFPFSPDEVLELQIKHYSSVTPEVSPIHAQKFVDFLGESFLNRYDVYPVFSRRYGFQHAYCDDPRGLLLGHIRGDKETPVKVHPRNNSKLLYDLWRVGAYATAPDGTGRFGCIDIDGQGHQSPVADPDGCLFRIVEILFVRKVPYLVERSLSGTGYHVWILFPAGTKAKDIRSFLFSVVPGDIPLAAGMGAADPVLGRGIEIFPKQDSLSEDGLGNFVWLPWWYDARPDCNQFYGVTRDETMKYMIKPRIHMNFPVYNLDVSKSLSSAFPTPNGTRNNFIGTKSRKKRDASNSDIRALNRLCPTSLKIFQDFVESACPSHFIRLRVAQIAIAIGFTDDQIVCWFSNKTNFDERKTRGYVQGLRKKFRFPGCESLAKQFRVCEGMCEKSRQARCRSPIGLIDWYRSDPLNNKKGGQDG